MTTRILILPGLFNSGAEHWQSQWERQFSGLHRVEQDDWETPVCADWVERLNHEISATKDDVVLVAHSLACTLIARWAEQYPDAKNVRGALMVAPSDTESDSYPEGTSGFWPMPLNRLPFPSIVVASTDDPYVTSARAEQFSNAWGSELIWIQLAGHISAQSGFGPWPEGMQLLLELTGDEQFRAL